MRILSCYLCPATGLRVAREPSVGPPPASEGYRERIYRHYVQARQHALAPPSIEGMRSRAPFLRRVIRDHFPADRDAAILELGCGYGALLHFARQAGYRNTAGIDASPQQVEAARRLGIEGVRESDVMGHLATRADQSLDAVIAFDVLEHFTKDELLPFVDEVHRVLRPGGRWIIHTANGESPFCGQVRYGDLTHELAFTRSSISQLLLASRFASVACHEDVPVPHGLKSAARWLLWQGIRGALRLYIAAETGSADPGYIFSQNFLAVAIK